MPAIATTRSILARCSAGQGQAHRVAAEEAASLDSALRSVLRKSARPGREDADRPNQKMARRDKGKVGWFRAEILVGCHGQKVKKSVFRPYAPAVLTLALPRWPNGLKPNRNPDRFPVFSSNTRTGD